MRAGQAGCALFALVVGLLVWRGCFTEDPQIAGYKRTVKDFLTRNVVGDARFPEASQITGIRSCTVRQGGGANVVVGCEWEVPGGHGYYNDFRISQNRVVDMYEWVSTDPTPLAGCGAFALGRQPVLPMALNPDQERQNARIRESWKNCSGR